MSRGRWFLLCVFPVLSLALSASDEKTPATPASTDAAASASESGVPALFSWADFDGDGRLDLAAVSAAGTLQLLVNAGEGRFEDVTERVGLSEVRSAALALWADYDRDGRLDLFVGALEGASRLFHNEAGVFIDMSAGSGLASEGSVQSAQWFDYDGDERLDLFVVTPEKNELFRGLEGGFFERLELPLAGLAGDVSPAGSSLPAPIPKVPPAKNAKQAKGPARRAGSVVVNDARASRRSGPAVGAAAEPPGSLPIVATPDVLCASSIEDLGDPGNCLQASSVPTLGLLYPISPNLFVASTGDVGIGTTSPAATLDVAGTARMTGTLTLNPGGDQALDVSTGSIYKDGVLFIHTKGGPSNTAIGREALAGVTTGYRNTGTGYRALFSNTTGYNNTASGFRALYNNTYGGNNTASGYLALASNTTGYGNTATGQDALQYNTTGIGNTASGAAALGNNTTGIGNTASGYRSLHHNTTGFFNTASGINALYSNTTGSENTASGVSALSSNTTGGHNTASGSRALSFNTTGVFNTGSGDRALYSNTTGYSNTASGERALFSNTTGGNNTASGSRALRSNTTGFRNAASGSRALYSNTTGNENTASGTRALFSNTTGGANTGSGYRALYTNTTGTGNTASGRVALQLNTTGAENTASGYSALFSNTTASHNTACGSRALRLNTTGSNNVASGSLALSSNTTGFNNTASGYRALFSNTTGLLNTAGGAHALYSNTTGTQNTACGGGALDSNTTGSRNIALGQSAGSSLTTGNDNIAIGNSGVAGDGATIRIGTSLTHTRAFIAGIHGVTTGVADAIPVLVDSAGQLGTVSSSRRFKKDIADMGDLTERLLELRPVVFRYKQEQKLPNGGEVPLEYGLIAEEVAEVFPDLVVYDEEGQPFTVKYHLLSSMLLNELKKEHEQLEAQGSEHERELRELKDLRRRVSALEARASTAATPADNK